jgi:hypothetical protein
VSHHETIAAPARTAIGAFIAVSRDVTPTKFGNTDVWTTPNGMRTMVPTKLPSLIPHKNSE